MWANQQQCSFVIVVDASSTTQSCRGACSPPLEGTEACRVNSGSGSQWEEAVSPWMPVWRLSTNFMCKYTRFFQPKMGFSIFDAQEQMRGSSIFYSESFYVSFQSMWRRFAKWTFSSTNLTQSATPISVSTATVITQLLLMFLWMSHLILVHGNIGSHCGIPTVLSHTKYAPAAAIHFLSLAGKDCSMACANSSAGIFLITCSTASVASSVVWNRWSPAWFDGKSKSHKDWGQGSILGVAPLESFLGYLRWVARFGLKWAKSVRAKSKHL